MCPHVLTTYIGVPRRPFVSLLLLQSLVVKETLLSVVFGFMEALA